MKSLKIIVFIIFLISGFNVNSYSQGNPSCSFPVLPGSSITEGGVGCADLYTKITTSFTNLNVGSTITINWGDGATDSYTSIAGSLNTVFVYTYPKSDVNCTYTATLVATKNCPVPSTATIPLQIDVWNTDRLMNIGPEILLCKSELPATVHFIDQTMFNCLSSPGIHNTDPRTLEWIYGGGGSTIAGVNIGGNPAPYTQPIITSVTGPGTNSMNITVPASAAIGEVFEVTLRNWNICNPYPTGTPETITQRIRIITAAPDLSSVSKDICVGNNASITIPGTNVTWYKTAVPSATDSVHFGNTFDPVAGDPKYPTYVKIDTTTGGPIWTKTLFINQREATCPSNTVPITITINAVPKRPTITLQSGSATFCYDGSTTVVLKANYLSGGSEPVIDHLQWYKDGVAVPGATANTLTLKEVAESGSYTVQIFGSPTSYCGSTSAPRVITINPLPLDKILTTTTPICSGTSTNIVVNVSQSGISYQLRNNATNALIRTVAGTGANINLSTGNITATTTYKVIARNTTTNCTYTLSTFPKVTVNPIPATPTITLTGANPTCVGSNTIKLESSTDINTDSYQWQKSGAPSPYAITKNIILAAIGESGDYRVRTIGIAPTNCPSSWTPYTTVTIYPLPDDKTVTAEKSSVCHGTGTRIIIANSQTGISYQLRNDPSNTTVGSAVSGTGGNIYLPTGNLSLPGPYTYNVLATNTTTNCQFQLTTKPSITVNPLPTAGISSDDADNIICSGDAVEFTGSGGTSYQFFVNGISVQPNSADNTYSTFSLANGDIVSVMVTDVNGCYKASAGITMTVNPIPTVVPSPPSQSICSGSATSISLTSSPTGASFAWTYSETVVLGGSAGSGNSITQTLTNGGASYATATYSVNATLSGCVSPAVNVVVDVSPSAPTIKPIIIGPSTMCQSGSNIKYYVSNPDLKTSSYTWDISSISGATIVGLTNTDTIILNIPNADPLSYITVIPKNGCGSGPASDPFSIVVNALPSATSVTQAICSDVVEGTTATVNLKLQESNINNSGSVTFSYYSNAAHTLSIGSPTSYTVLNGTIIYVVVHNTATSCDNSATITYTVNPRPIANNLTRTVCSDGTEGTTAYVNLNSLNSAIDGGNGYTITYFTDASLALAYLIPDATHYQVTSGVTVYAKVIHGSCQNSATVTYTVNPRPTAIDQIPGALCSDNANENDRVVNLTLLSSAIDGPYSYTIDWFSNAALTTTIPTPSSYNVTHNVPVYARVTNGLCQDTATVTNTINPTPNITNTDLNDGICTGSALSFAPTGDVAGTTYNWTSSVTSGTASGNTTGSGNITNTLTNSTYINAEVTYNIIPTRAGCNGDAKNYIATVYPKPDVSNVDLRDSICSGSSVNFSPTSHVTGATFNWINTESSFFVIDPGNGSGIINHALTNSGLSIELVTYAITPRANGCNGDPVNYLMYVKPKPGITNIDLRDSICSGGTLNFHPTGSIPSTTFNWSSIPTNVSGNTLTSSGNITDNLINTGTTIGQVEYDITPTLDGCSGSTAIYMVYVVKYPEIVSISDDQVKCIGGTAYYNIFANGSNISFQWQKWNGSAFVNLPEAAPYSETTTNSLKVSDITTALNGENYQAQITNEGICSLNSPSRTLIVNPPPVLNTLSDIIVCPGDIIDPNDFETVPSGSDYSWTNNNLAIGIDLSGTDQIASWTAKNTTTDSIKAVITVSPTLNSCPGSSKSFNIIIKPKPFLSTVRDTVVCPGENISIPAFSSTPVTSSFSWINTGDTRCGLTSGSGNIPAYVAPSNTSAGHYTGIISATANLHGCISNTVTFNVGVKPTPGTSAISGIVNVCASTPTFATTQIYRTDLPSGTPGSTYVWTVTSSTPASAEPINYLQFNNSLLVDFSTSSWTGTIQVVETSLEGCAGQPRTATLRSYDVPVVNAGNDTSICGGDNIILGGFPTASGGSSSYTYNWSPAAGLDDRTKSNPIAHPSGPITYSLTVTDAISSCVSQPDYIAIDLNALPAAPTGVDPAICDGEPIPDLTAIGSDIKWYLDEELTNLVSTDNPFTTGNTTPGTYYFYATQMVSGCESAPREFTLSINNIPKKPDVSDITICYGQDVPDLVFTGTGVRWYDDAALTHLVKNGNIFTSGKVDPGVYTYYVTQTTNNCESPSDTVILKIKSRPDAPDAIDHTVCANDLISDLSATGTNIRWYSSSFLTTVIDSGNTFNTGNSAPGTYTYFATQTVSGCQSAAKTVNLVIRPFPEVISSFSTDETLCNSGDGKITIIATGTPPLKYSINGGTSYSFSGNFASLGNGNYPVSVQNNYGCIDYGDTLKISSGSAPVKPVAGSNATYCQGQPIANLFATPLSGGTITWYKDAALTTALSNTLSFAPDNVIGTTYYYVTETYGGCESPSVNIAVTINALPTAPQINDTIVCTNMGIPTLHANGNNIYWYNDAALTHIANYGNYYVTGVTSSGNYTWYLASSNLGCRGPVTDVTLTIQETPATPLGTNTISCEGSPLPALTATGDNIHWYSNSSLTSEVNTGNSYNTGNTAPGDYKYYLVGDDGHCKSNASVIMQTIYAIPTKPIGLDRTICEEQPTPSLVTSGASVKWYSDAALTDFIQFGSVISPSHTIPGTYTYYATQTINGCQSAPDTIVLLIKPKPAKPVASDVTSCEGDITPSLKTTGISPKWYYLINQVGTGPVFSTGKTSPGIWVYGVTQTIDGCESDPEDVQLTINAAPVYSNTDFTDQTACNSNDGTITVYATGFAPLTYSIDDGTTYQASNFFGGLKNAFYPVRIKNGYGCTKPGDTIAIHDGGAPKAPFALKDTTYCANNVFVPLEANASVSGTLTWYSDWGLKSILSTGNLQMPTLIPGKTHYYVTETSGDCESDPTILTVSINLMPFPPASRDTALCYGLPVPNLIAEGEGIEWFNSPSLTSVIASGESFATGRRDSGVYVYYVTQLIDGCRSSATIDTLTIYPKPTIDFEPSVDQGCSPLTINFNNASSGSVFTWTFGDKTSESTYSPSHTYVNNSYSQKNYPVKLVANNKYNCSNSLIKFVTIFPFPNYKFSMIPDEGCQPVTVSFSSPHGAQNYDWNFGDFTSLSGKNNNTTNTYENDTYDRDTTYVVTLTATSAYGCSDTYHDTLKVHPNPDVSFTTDVQEACNPFTPLINNLSIGATSYRWNFGDNSEESLLITPTHTYNNTSAFTAPYIISLRANNDFGCSNTFTQNVRVYPPMDAAFTSATAGCSPLKTKISNQSWGSGLSYYWTTSDYQSSGDMNPSFTFNNVGFDDSTYTVMLIAQSQQNCFDTAISQIVVYARPKANFLVTPSQLLYPERTFNITQNTNDSPSGIWQYTWNFGDTTSHNRDPQQHTYDTSGTFTIRLKVDGVFCFDTLSQIVKIILPAPIASFDSIAPDCSPYTVQFKNNSIYAETYRWAFGDGSFSNKKDPKHEYWDAGTYVVTLSVEGPGGKDIHQGLVTTHPLPKARFEIEPSFVYVPDQPVKGFNQSEYGQIFEWDFGDSSAINHDSIPLHYYQRSGQYNITLWARTNTVPQCSDSLTKEKAVVADAAGKLKLPNAFRPSQGGSGGGHYTPGGYNNNIFYPPVTESVIEYKLIVYNRWGQKLFESKNLKQGWDGYFDGKLCEQGVYVWRVEGRYANKQTFVKMGDVTLLR